jgi:hypothetical protein
VKNTVPRFQLVEWRRPFADPEVLELRFRNGYNKPITVFELKLGKGFKNFADLIQTGEYIEPGQEHVVTKVLPTGETLGVLGVVFDDGSFDGDPSFAQYIKHRRLGLRIQFQRISLILQQASTSPNASHTIDDLVASIASLPTDITGIADAKFGLVSARDRVVLYLRDLHQTAGGVAEAATVYKLARLGDLCNMELRRLVEIEARQHD